MSLLLTSLALILTPLALMLTSLMVLTSFWYHGGELKPPPDLRCCGVLGLSAQETVEGASVTDALVVHCGPTAHKRRCGAPVVPRSGGNL